MLILLDDSEANNYTEHYAVYERVRISQVVADLKEHNIATAAAWDDLTQDIPYQRGTHFVSYLFSSYLISFQIYSVASFFILFVLVHVLVLVDIICFTA